LPSSISLALQLIPDPMPKSRMTFKVFCCVQPPGGRKRDVLLREYQVLMKRHVPRAQKAAERAAHDRLDPFVPEYTADTWHQATALLGVTIVLYFGLCRLQA